MCDYWDLRDDYSSLSAEYYWTDILKKKNVIWYLSFYLLSSNILAEGHIVLFDRVLLL